MKNILMMILGVGLALGAAAAQPKLANGGRLVGGGRPAKVIVVRPSYGYYPYRLGYNPFYSPFYGYNAFYYSPYTFQRTPSKLDLEIEQINNDYHHEIAEARHDETLSKSERKHKIRDLRHERQNSIIDAKKGYYEKKEKDTE
jgi:hypothetical protein